MLMTAERSSFSQASRERSQLEASRRCRVSFWKKKGMLLLFELGLEFEMVC